MTITTTTCAHAYFTGFSDADGRACEAALSEVVMRFAAAHRVGRVAREACRSYIAGWRQAEAMSRQDV